MEGNAQVLEVLCRPISLALVTRLDVPEIGVKCRQQTLAEFGARCVETDNN